MSFALCKMFSDKKVIESSTLNLENKTKRNRSQKTSEPYHKWTTEETLKILSHIHHEIQKGFAIGKPSARIYYTDLLNKCKLTGVTVSKVYSAVRTIHRKYSKAIVILEGSTGEQIKSTHGEPALFALMEKMCPHFNLCHSIWSGKGRIPSKGTNSSTNKSSVSSILPPPGNHETRKASENPLDLEQRIKLENVENLDFKNHAGSSMEVDLDSVSDKNLQKKVDQPSSTIILEDERQNKCRGQSPHRHDSTPRILSHSIRRRCRVVRTVGGQRRSEDESSTDNEDDETDSESEMATEYLAQILSQRNEMFRMKVEMDRMKLEFERKKWAVSLEIEKRKYEMERRLESKRMEIQNKNITLV